MPYLTATPLELTETVRRLADLLMFTRAYERGPACGPHSIAADYSSGLRVGTHSVLAKAGNSCSRELSFIAPFRSW